MFFLDIPARLLASLASFLFPVYASYKAIKTSDPAQLTPWLMYWVVLASTLLVESWLGWILVWIPFYAYIRLLFLLYLILPQMQGARFIYTTYLHPWLQENETQIEEFIVDAHEKLKVAGMSSLKQLIELVRTSILGLPPSEPQPSQAAEPASAQSYTQSLLSRFSVPAARWPVSGTGGSTSADFYNLLASAVSAATGIAGGVGGSGSKHADLSASGTLIPPNLSGAAEKMTFIQAQRERLNILLRALDREATEIERQQKQQGEDSPGAFPRAARPGSLSLDGAADDEPSPVRPPSGLSGFSGLSKSRSEADFEKIDAESGAEDEGAEVRRRAAGRDATPAATGGGSWLPWGWGTATPSAEQGHSTGVERHQS